MQTEQLLNQVKLIFDLVIKGGLLLTTEDGYNIHVIFQELKMRLNEQDKARTSTIPDIKD